jgi:cobaltochelatase CobN
MRWLAALLLIMSLAAGEALPCIGFIGVWDRAMATLDAAARDNGMQAVFLPRGVPEDAALRPLSLICVLNIAADEAGPLATRLAALRAAGTTVPIVALDRRDSQTALQRAGVMVADARIPAYWKANGPVNLRRLFAYLGITYLGRGGTTEPPILVPEQGYYLPGRDEPFSDLAAFRAAAAWRDGAPRAALCIQQSFWITQDTRVVDALVAALHANGIDVATCFAEKSEQMVALVMAVKPDLVVEDRHGGMWPDGGSGPLADLGVPYLRPISMLGATIAEWLENPQGLNARDRGMFLSLQERLGTIEPLVVGGLVVNTAGFRLHEPIPDRVERFAERAAAWAALRRTKPAKKRLAIFYYNKYLGKGDLMRGSPTGAFMDGPESLIRVLPRLAEHGYAVDGAPSDAASLITLLSAHGRNLAPWAAGELETMANQPGAILVPAERYRAWFDAKLDPELRQAVEKRHGPPPGRFMVVKRNGEDLILIPGVRMGNVLLLPQPERGEPQDETLLHSRDVPPPHNYLAVHWWLQEEYRPQAVVMWGTHGSLELLPGKEAGLSGRDWSDICLGTMPVVYPWIMDNLGEATLARRRAYACLVDHLPPLGSRTVLPDDLRNLHEDVHKFEGLEAGVLREEFRTRISRAVRAARIPGVPAGAEPLPDAAIQAAGDWLHRQAEEATPTTLHVLGQVPDEARLVDALVASLRDGFLERLAAIHAPPAGADRTAWLKEQGRAVISASVLADAAPAPSLADDVAQARALLGRLRQSDREIAAIIEALDGRFVAPGPGPDPVRNPAAAPGGRNLYGLNPEEIPTRASYAVAERLVAELLAQKKPGKVGIDLNGMETMRDFGVNESQVMCLLGVRPVWDHNNLAVDVELIPRAELKHPRTDVFVAMGGQYKENFPSRVKLLDKAVRLAATAAEEDNGVRSGSARLREALLKHGVEAGRAGELADARIFGTKPGNMSGTNILYLIPRSGVWDDPNEVAQIYIDSMSYVFTGEHWGERIDGLYEGAIQGTDTLVRVWASNMTSQLSNHHAYEYLGGLSMAVRTLTGKEPEAFIADVRNPDGARMRRFEEVLESNLRSELLNKEWLAGMKAHDYAGAGHIAELTKNTFGWAVTRPESVDPRVWQEIYEVLVQDRYKLGLRTWFEQQNPAAVQEIAATLLEAARKGHWKPDASTERELAELYAAMAVKHGAASGMVGGGNRKLDERIAALAPGQAAAYAQAVEASRTKPAGDQVLGKRLAEQAKPPQPAQQPAPASAKPQPRQQPDNERSDLWRWLAGAAVLALIIFGAWRRSGSVR